MHTSEIVFTIKDGYIYAGRGLSDNEIWCSIDDNNLYNSRYKHSSGILFNSEKKIPDVIMTWIGGFKEVLPLGW
jgi:hypothetical protein